MNFDYSIETRQNDLLYWGRLNTVFVKSDFLENAGINYGVEIRPLNNCIVKGIYPTIDIIPIDRPICSIQVYDQTELKITKHFVVTDIPNPLLTSEELRDWNDDRTTNLDEVIQSEVRLVDLKKIKRIQTKVIDHAGNYVTRFHLTQFNFSVLRGREIVFKGSNNGEELSKDIQEFIHKIQPGDRIIIDDITCHLNEYENERRIEKKYNYNIVTVK